MDTPAAPIARLFAQSGNLSASRTESLGATGPAFTVLRDRLGRDNVDAGGGLDLLAGASVRVELSGYPARRWSSFASAAG